MYTFGDIRPLLDGPFWVSIELECVKYAFVFVLFGFVGGWNDLSATSE